MTATFDTLGIAREIGDRLAIGVEKAAKKELKKRSTAAHLELAAYVRTFTAQARKFAGIAAELQSQGDSEGAKLWAHHAMRSLHNLDRVNKAAAS